MTIPDPTPVPDAAVQMLRESGWIIPDGGRAYETVAALRERGWLHDPDELAALRAFVATVQEARTAGTLRCPADVRTALYDALDALLALDALPARDAAPRTLTADEMRRAYELCAQVCAADTATVAGGYLGQLRDLLAPTAGLDVR
jgi:hypothetical protein